MKTGCLFLLLCFAGGCASYTEAQMRLVEQARKGVEAAKSASAERAKLVSQLQQLQRMQLDSAFDTDVRAASALTGDWVIEHRRAYAAVLDALALQKAASAQAESAALANLEAMDAALSRVLFLQSIQLRIETLDGRLGK